MEMSKKMRKNKEKTENKGKDSTPDAAKKNMFTRFIHWVAEGSRREAEKGALCST